MTDMTAAAGYSVTEFGGVGCVTVITTVAADAGVTGGGGGGGGDLVSKEALGTVQVVLSCAFQVSIILVGIPGNILSLLVLGKQGLGDRVNVLLFSLAVADLINIITLLLQRIACFLRLFDPIDAANWSVITSSQVVYLHLWANFVSAFLIVIMAVDRCISVAFPLKASRIITYRRMLAAIATVYIVLFAAYAPSLFLYTVHWRVDPATNRSMAVFTTVDNFAIDKKIPGDITAVFSFGIKPASVGLVVICTIITVVRLKQATKRRHQMTSEDRSQLSKSETRITKMLIFLSVIYLVLVFPDICASVVHERVPEFFLYRKYHNTFILVFVVIQAAAALNSSVNFFAYLLLSSKFRATLADTLPCIKPLLRACPYKSHAREDLEHSSAKTSKTSM